MDVNNVDVVTTIKVERNIVHWAILIQIDLNTKGNGGQPVPFLS